MRPPALAVVLAALCVLAGCNALAPGTDPRSSAPSVTPADVPSDTTDADVESLAPGLSESGFSDRDELFLAHRSLLANRSVSTELRVVEWYRGRVVSNYTQTTRVGADRTRTVVEMDVERSPTTTLAADGVFSNGSVSLAVRRTSARSPAGATASSSPRYPWRGTTWNGTTG